MSDEDEDPFYTRHDPWSTGRRQAKGPPGGPPGGGGGHGIWQGKGGAGQLDARAAPRRTKDENGDGRGRGRTAGVGMPRFPREVAILLSESMNSF